MMVSSNPKRNKDINLTPLQHTYEDAGCLLAVSVRTVERLVAQGELDSVGTGKMRRITRASILSYIERHRNEVA